MKKIIIIGGGAVGLSVAYHLARRGEGDVTLLERNQLTSGTSWHAAGIVGPLRATASMTRIASHALTLFPELEAETGMSTGYRRTGGYWLARQPERMDELHRIAAVGRHMGLTPQVFAPRDVQVPQLDLSGHVGALMVPEDANVNPVDLCMAYARAAKNRGVKIREGVEVSRITTREARVTGVALADDTEMAADCVVLCAGAWSRKLADEIGVALPLQAVEHMYIVTEPIAGLPNPFPVVRDLDAGIYVKGDAGRLVIGGFEPNAKAWNAYGPEGNRAFLEMPEDWEQFGPFMEAALALIPQLAEVGIQRFMNGPESFTADTRPLVGETPEVDGLFVAAGMNSVGIMSSAGIGAVLADWIAAGAEPRDLWGIDIARVDAATAAPEHMKERMKEAVSDLFAMHWPFKQPTAGRGLRKSALHDHWAAQGAVFGLTVGWERGLWYARSNDERDLPYSAGDQPWQAIAESEAAQMKDGTALLDLSPFSKIDVSGPGALRLLNQMATAQMDVTQGRAVYTLMLNAKGGIEADVTITRLGDSAFRIVSAAATRRRDLALLRRAARGLDVVIADRTEEFCVIGVMGAGSRGTLAALSKDDWNAFAFSTARDVTIAGVRCSATRISYVGDLGWEITVANDSAGKAFDALIGAGARPMGHYALNGCRIEKGYRHWGHDLGPEITPLEAGLGFAVDWKKDFNGKAALLKQKQDGISQRLVLLDVEGHPLIVHDEPVTENGAVVGLTTSGAKGARTGLTLALALVSVKKNEMLAETAARSFMVDVAGKSYQTKVLSKVPFDPAGERMRG
ncbi:GcvT family protein [Aestuariivirga litoralis]|uniref:GcvT family protein n=1 Tax=Aestuariivirga litoralis TaxID=2650924 RepID=UPI0018C4C67F|nr:FAD-dependent oxidoreductase [Aestuariivirga litoralis]MBG1232580.1 FAD-dependent oxidoreductase [Aestuariivirga litoralis]